MYRESGARSSAKSKATTDSREPGPRILVIDSDPKTIRFLRESLKPVSYRLVAFQNGVRGLQEARLQFPDLVILELALPDMDGTEVCKALRNDPRTCKTWIIILSLCGSAGDRIRGLEAGADDYIVKPVHPRELIIRVRNFLPKSDTPEEELMPLYFDELCIDVSRHVVRVGSEIVSLTLTEFRLLAMLALQPGRVRSRSELVKALSESSRRNDSRSIDTHMRRLRSKLARASRFLETVHGVGYRFAVNET